MSTERKEIHLDAGESVRLVMPSGMAYEVGPESDLSDGEVLSVRQAQGENVLVLPSGCVNVVRLAMWPTFQPVVPPTPESPVQVSRDMVQEVLSPRSNGVGTEVVAHLQTKVDSDPRLREVLTEIIERHTEKYDNGRYESVRIKDPEGL